MRHRWVAVGATAGFVAVATLGGVTAAQAQTAHADAAPERNSRHVLVISVDGMHQTDLAAYVKSHPSSTIAGLVNHGLEYTAAKTTLPSDSFPGMVAQTYEWFRREKRDETVQFDWTVEDQVIARLT